MAAGLSALFAQRVGWPDKALRPAEGFTQPGSAHPGPSGASASHARPGVAVNRTFPLEIAHPGVSDFLGNRKPPLEIADPLILYTIVEYMWQEPRICVGLCGFAIFRVCDFLLHRV